MNTFGLLKDFKNIQQNCIFCQDKLSFSVSNYFGSRIGILDYFNITPNKNSFDISFISNNKKYLGYLGTNTNKLIFYNNETLNSIYSSTAYNLFNKLSLHLAISCANSSCQNKYAISSSPLEAEIDKHSKCSLVLKIKPVQVFMESFCFGEYWIMNNQSTNMTFIYHKEDYDKEPIEINLINWKNISVDKIESKLKTIITLF